MTAPILSSFVRSSLVRRGVAVLAALAVSSSIPCRAQSRDAVVTAIVRLTNAIGGAFGDEGTQAAAALGDAENALAAWDASIQRAEHGFATDRASASPAAAAQMQAAIGSIYVERGRYADAIRQLVAAGAQEPGTMSPVASQLLSAAQRAAGHTADAGETLRAAVVRHPRDPALMTLAVEETEPSDTDVTRAIDVLLDAALAASPQAGGTTPFLSLALVGSAAGSDPIFPPARYVTAYSLLEGGAFDEGLRAVRAAMAQDPLVAAAATQPRAFFDGVAALRQGDIPSALAQLRAAVAETPRSSEVHRLLGMALWSDGTLDAAQRELAAAVNIDPLDERAALAAADVAREAEQDAAARDLLGRAAAAVATSGQAHWSLARLLEGAHLDDEALTHFEKAAAAAPITGAGQVFGSIGRIHHSRLDLEAAAAAYRQRVHADPNSARAHRQLGDVLQAADRHAQAAVEFLAAAWLDPQDAESYALAGQSLLAAGRTADAERTCRRALAIDARQVTARFTLAAVLPRLGRAEEGRQQLDEYRRLQQESLAAQRRGMEINGLKLRAQVAAQNGDHRAAADTWRQVIAQEGPQPESAMNLAHALAAAGEIDAAAAAYRDALAHGAGLRAQRALVDLLERSGRTTDAAAARATYDEMKRNRLRQLGAVR